MPILLFCMGVEVTNMFYYELTLMSLLALASCFLDALERVYYPKTKNKLRGK